MPSIIIHPAKPNLRFERQFNDNYSIAEDFNGYISGNLSDSNDEDWFKTVINSGYKFNVLIDVKSALGKNTARWGVEWYDSNLTLLSGRIMGGDNPFSYVVPLQTNTLYVRIKDTGNGPIFFDSGWYSIQVYGEEYFVGQTLTFTVTGIDDRSQSLSITGQQWYRNGTAIEGATEPEYQLTKEDIANAITIEATYSVNSEDPVNIMSSEAGIILNINAHPTGSIAIIGTLEEKQTLTADTSSLADDDGLGTFSYQWFRDGSEITGATGSAYTTTAIDIDKALSVTISYTDGYGTVETITSESSDAIAKAIPTILSTTHLTSILVDEGILGALPIILQGLAENIEETDGVTTNHVFSFNGSDYDYDDISPFIMIVVRDNEFTDDFRNELADFAPEFKDISYQDAVAAVGLVGIADAIITVAGADGNYIG